MAIDTSYRYMATQVMDKLKQVPTNQPSTIHVKLNDRFVTVKIPRNSEDEPFKSVNVKFEMFHNKPAYTITGLTTRVVNIYRTYQIKRVCNDYCKLHQLCREGNLPRLTQLAALGIDLNRKDLKGNTPLLIAASNGHTRCAKFLVNAGADITITNKDNYSPIQCIRSHALSKLVLDTLLRNKQSSKASYFLIVHAELNNHKIVEYALRQRGQHKCEISLEAVNAIGNTALHAAAMRGNAKCLRLLLAHDVDFRVTNKKLHTPLYDAACNGHTDCVKILLNKYLTDGKCSKPTDFDSAVRAAEINRHKKIAELLRKHKIVN
ncbi:MAG: ankyrin repeat domain-containing protein [Parashewanella sp.]